MVGLTPGTGTQIAEASQTPIIRKYKFINFRMIYYLEFIEVCIDNEIKLIKYRKPRPKSDMIYSQCHLVDVLGIYQDFLLGHIKILKIKILKRMKTKLPNGKDYLDSLERTVAIERDTFVLKRWLSEAEDVKRVTTLSDFSMWSGYVFFRV